MLKCDTKYREECNSIEQEEIVLIGGSFDRQVIYIDKSTTSYVQMQIVSPDNDANNAETYVLKTIKGTGNFFRIGVVKEWDMDDVMSRLISYYQEGNSMPIGTDLVEV